MKKRNIFLILSALFPIIIVIFCNILKGNSFSNVSRLPDVDLQYIPLLKYLKSVFTFDNSIVYCFSKSLGGSMFATYFYYLSSPLNFICIFFKSISHQVINLLIYIKIGLCGLTMYIFLNNKSDKFFINFVFSLCYSLMGYNIIYGHNVMWLDVVYIAPITCMGIDKLIIRDDCRLYVFSLLYALWCNFYIAFSLCIFSVIYLFYKIFKSGLKNKTKIVKKFFLISILVGCVCAFFLIPIFVELFNLKNRIVMKSLINYDFNNLPLLLYKYLIGSSSLKSFSNGYLESPNVYCSIFVLLLNMFYLFCCDVSKKEKIFIIIIELFFVSSMIFQPLYLMWHCFSVTNGNSYRFSFLWCFFHIYISYKSIIKIYSNSFFYYRKIILCGIAFLLLFILVYFSNFYPFFYNGVEILISIVFFVLYFILIKKRFFNYCFLLLVIELIINCYISLDYSSLPSVYRGDRINLCKIYDNLDSVNNRINAFGLNNSLYCGYSSFSGYYTTFSNNLFKFSDNLSIVYRQNLILDDSFNSEIIESILGIDYSIDDNNNVFKNNNILSIGYLIEYDKINYNDSVLHNQQAILNSMIGENFNYFHSYSITKVDNQKYYYIGNGKEKYLYIDDKKTNSRILKLRINGIYQENKELGYMGLPYKLIRIRDSSDKVFIDFSTNCVDDGQCIIPEIDVYEINYELFNKAIDKLKKHQLVVTKMEKNTLEGNIDVTKDNQYLFLSIPYEKGWNIYVDGKKVTYEKLYDAFIGIKLDKGHHDIKMIFYPQGLNVGIIISICSAFILIVYLRRKK